MDKSTANEPMAPFTVGENGIHYCRVCGSIVTYRDGRTVEHRLKNGWRCSGSKSDIRPKAVR